MRFPRSHRAAIASSIVIGAVLIACSPTAPAAARDTPAPATSPSSTREITRDEAIRLARDYVVEQRAAEAVYLDSAQAEAVDPLWRVTFRRRALVAPAVLTVDVNRRTRAIRFPGDE